MHVLECKEPADNPRKITPAVAVVLLAHYIGDLHQPLHVGALYLNKQGEARYPGRFPDTLSDMGGNLIDFGATNLHAYWDVDVVEHALNLRRQLTSSPNLTTTGWAAELSQHEPNHWKGIPSAAPDGWIDEWADEMLAESRDVHDKLTIYPAIETKDKAGKPVYRWAAVAKPVTEGEPYDVWSARVTADNLHRAGWRLAAILEAVLEKSGTGLESKAQ
jgi:hypothetical protein